MNSHGTLSLALPVSLAATVAAGITGPTRDADATWSIAIADGQTGEVAVGTVTCLTSLDLCAIVPVVVVGKGAAAVQAAGDFNGVRRPVIFEGLQIGTPPAEILLQLADISGHQSRQYGIVDTNAGAITFTGASTFQWAGGVTGTDGDMVYAIQGNILAGGCVVPAIEAAILGTGGDMAAKLLAGMQAARDTGGDGRCSCSQQNPTSCGCPPAAFSKSGHIGCMIVARLGDGDDANCNAAGCADGDYYMRLNVPNQPGGAPDPVDQLEDLFDDWRTDITGRPDGLRSTTVFDPPAIPPNGIATTTLRVTLLDWQGDPITVPVETFFMVHAPDSAGCRRSSRSPIRAAACSTSSCGRGALPAWTGSASTWTTASTASAWCRSPSSSTSISATSTATGASA